MENIYYCKECSSWLCLFEKLLVFFQSRLKLMRFGFIVINKYVGRVGKLRTFIRSENQEKFIRNLYYSLCHFRKISINLFQKIYYLKIRQRE